MCSVLEVSFQVSWIRHDDTHLLTTGMYRYTPDQRFSSLHKPSSENWVLEIRNTAIEDQGCSLIYISPFDYYFIPSGIYECQISTTPVRSLRFNLEVVGNEDFDLNNKICFLR